MTDFEQMRGLAAAENERRRQRFAQACADYRRNAENRATEWPMPFPYPEFEVVAAERESGGYELRQGDWLVAEPLVAWGPAGMLLIGGAGTVEHRVVADVHARVVKGTATYGGPLVARDGRDSLTDAYEEALDQAMYLKKALIEREQAAALLGEIVAKIGPDPSLGWVAEKAAAAIALLRGLQA